MRRSYLTEPGDDFELRPQALPKSWDINVTGAGLKTATQAFAKIFDDINRIDLNDLRAK
jgi:hypothetical protein